MDVREKLLEAAAAIYARTGFRGATTRRIAQQAGVNEVTLFRHFGSKASLLQEAIACSASELATPGLPDPPQDPQAELTTWAQQHLAALREKRSLIRTCMGEIDERPDLIPREGSAPARAGHALRLYLQRLQESGRARPDFDPVAAASMLMGALFADAMGRDVMPDLYSNRADHALDQYVGLFLRAIGATPDVLGA